MVNTEDWCSRGKVGQGFWGFDFKVQKFTNPIDSGMMRGFLNWKTELSNSIGMISTSDSQELQKCRRRFRDQSSKTGSSLATCDRSQVESTISIISKSIFLGDD